MAVGGVVVVVGGSGVFTHAAVLHSRIRLSSINWIRFLEALRQNWKIHFSLEFSKFDFIKRFAKLSKV